jgi:chromate transporter
VRLDVLAALALVFVPVSLSSIGGGAATIAGIQHSVVELHRWATSDEFISLFAVSRAAPGPGMMLATVVGWHVAGWEGAVVATLALFLPSSLLCIAVVKLTNAYRDQTWHRAMREGLAPVGIGLIMAGVIILLRVSNAGIHGFLIAAAAACALTCFPRFPALVLLFLGGLVSAALWASGFVS